MALPTLFPPPPPTLKTVGLAPSPPVQILGPAAGAPNPVADFLKDSGKLSQRPKRMGGDVWSVLQEYVKEGGLLDLSEEVASLAQLEQEVRDSELTLAERASLLIKINDKRVVAKEKYLKVQEARRNYITFDMFAVFLDDLLQILMKRVGDEALLKQIGVDLNESALRLRTRMKGG